MVQLLSQNKRQRTGEETGQATRLQQARHYTESEHLVLQQAARILNVTVSDLPLSQHAPQTDPNVPLFNSCQIQQRVLDLAESQQSRIRNSIHQYLPYQAKGSTPDSPWVDYDATTGVHDPHARLACKGLRPLTTANIEFTGPYLPENHNVIKSPALASSIIGAQLDFCKNATQNEPAPFSNFHDVVPSGKASFSTNTAAPLMMPDNEFPHPTLQSGCGAFSTLTQPGSFAPPRYQPITQVPSIQAVPNLDFLPEPLCEPHALLGENPGSAADLEYEVPQLLNSSPWSTSLSNSLLPKSPGEPDFEAFFSSQIDPHFLLGDDAMMPGLDTDLSTDLHHNLDSLQEMDSWGRLLQPMPKTLFPESIAHQRDFETSGPQLVLGSPSPGPDSIMESNKTRKRRSELASATAISNQREFSHPTSPLSDSHSRSSLEETIFFSSPRQIQMGEEQRPRVRQAFRDPHKRKETGETRKSGACFRCRMQRIRCSPTEANPGGPCVTCAKVSAPTLYKLPCMRSKITDASLFDKGSHPQYRWSQRWSSWDLIEIDTWASSEIKTITITQDVFGGSTFKIRCREFVPVEGDSLARMWKKDGAPVYYQRAPYAVLSMKETGREIREFVAKNNRASIKYYITEKQDPLLSRTYAMAYAMVFRPNDFADNEEGKLLLQEVFQLWVAIRMESQSERIVGEETLGMEPQFFDPNVSSYGTNSITPMMSAQLELMTTTRMLQPLKKAVLQRLQRMIHANELRSWFPIYLCLFVLLHSCSILTADEHRQARKYGLKTRYVYDVFIEELHTGAKTMIYYFHYCNKGSHPFTRNWMSQENLTLANLNDEQAQFLRDSAVLIQERMPEFRKIRESKDFENDWYFVSQLFDVDWKPAFTV